MTTNPWFERLQRFAVQEITTAQGRVAWREAGGAESVTHILLHGIGSSSANWLAQLEAASDHPALRVVAWDAPGYGRSEALTLHTPTAADYAERQWAWLDALAAIENTSAPGRVDSAGAAQHPVSPFILVGHSLGCLIAASAARQRPQRVAQLILLSPAQGYARAPAAEREKKLQDRLAVLARLGPAGMAQLRGAAMLAPHADADKVALVQHIMAQIEPHGYTQAARMLAEGDLLADLSLLSAIRPNAVAAALSLGRNLDRVVVASGSVDTITPSAGCQQVATAIGAPYFNLGAVGHACAIEAADQVTLLIGLDGANLPAEPGSTFANSKSGASHAP